MNRPFDAIDDITKRPFMSFSLDELPASIAEKIHDMPPAEDLELWIRAKKSVPYGVIDLGLGGFWHVPEYPATDNDNRSFVKFNPFESPVCDFECERPYLPDVEHERLMMRGQMRSESGNGLGFHQFTVDRPFVLHATRSGARRKEPSDPSTLRTGALTGFFASPSVEALMREASGGMIDTLDIVIEPHDLKVSDESLSRRLVDVLGRWQPYDLERSELKWAKFRNRFEIIGAMRVVLREDWPENIKLFRGMHRQAMAYCRRELISEFEAIGSQEMSMPEVNAGTSPRTDHGEPWWRNFNG